MADVVIVGAGHNGLVAACYLAMAGRSVVVLEAQDRPGGGSRTEATIPGMAHLFDLHSAAHNIINMTSIPDELDLAAAGLDYQEMDPFSVAVFADGRRVRFHRSVEQTVDSIAETDPTEAKAYEAWMRVAQPLIRATMPAIRGEQPLRGLPKRALDVARFFGPAPLERFRDLAGPYDSLLRRWLPSDLTRGPVAAFAAHAGVSPVVPGSALFAFWQAAYHQHGQWHARGGAQGLINALVTRATALGVEIRCAAPVTRIDTTGGRVRAVHVGGPDGDRIPTAAVITAIDPKLALLELCDPPLSGRDGTDLAATRRGNVVQAVIHLATTSLPAHADARPGDHDGLQSYVDSLDDLTTAWVRAEAGLLPDPLPLYAFTHSGMDDSLAPPGQHTVYLACPAAPARIEGGWEANADRFLDQALTQVDRHIPGFSSTVIGHAIRHPDLMVAGEGWPGAHPMHLDIAPDQLGPFRPTRRLGSHATPIDGLFISGAGTNPSGGIAGTPGKLAAQRLLTTKPTS